MRPTPRMTTSAVRPYHQLFCRERFADRTAARLRFAREAFVTPGRLLAARRQPGCMPGVLGHRQGASQREIHPCERQHQHACAREPTARETPGRTVVLDEHPVRMPRSARALNVRDGAARFVRDVEARAPEPPTEIEILDVHEVALVPAADDIERATTQPYRRTR